MLWSADKLVKFYDLQLGNVLLDDLINSTPNVSSQAMKSLKTFSLHRRGCLEFHSHSLKSVRARKTEEAEDHEQHLDF